MSHAQERVEERLLQAGRTYDECDQLYKFAEAYAARTHAISEAVRIQVLPHLVGTYMGDESNGNEVWAIYRERSLWTVMLRRSEQPDYKLRVDKVTRLV